MKKKKQQMIQPTYYRNFQCDPDRCKETCCERWQILIDRETSLKYANSSHLAIKELAATGISRNAEAIGEDDYAVINLTKELTCPFLNQDSLCEVVLKMGDEALSKTCRTFPRSIWKVGGEWERGLVMSCSVACEIALQDGNGIRFEEVASEFSEKQVHVNYFTEFSEEEEYRGVFLREQMIGLMQNRAFGLSERVIQIGEFLEDVLRQGPYETMEWNEFCNLTKMARERVEKMSLPPTNLNWQFHHLNQILSMKFQKGDAIRFFSKRYIECLMPVLDVYSQINGTNSDDFYREGDRKYLQPYLNKKAYLLENYLVNYLFVYAHEFFDQERIWEAYLKFAVIFGLLKFNLIGLGLSQKELTDQTVLKLIQSFAKTFVPDRQYFDSVFRYMREEKIGDCMGLRMLLMNG